MVTDVYSRMYKSYSTSLTADLFTIICICIRLNEWVGLKPEVVETHLQDITEIQQHVWEETVKATKTQLETTWPQNRDRKVR